MMEEVGTSEIPIYFYETIWCDIPEGCTFHTCSHENVKSHRNRSTGTRESAAMRLIIAFLYPTQEM
jgi:hypothetical protein